MNGIEQKTEITELNIEEMSIFAEAVLHAVYIICFVEEMTLEM